MLRGRVATPHPPCSNATPTDRSAHSARSSATPLTSGLNGPTLLAAKSTIVRFPTLAAVGGTGVLDKHISPVPVRELSLLLLPRTLGVCTHLGKTSTGSAGALPELPAGGRLALVDES